MPKKKLPKIDLDACVGCEACVSACPESVLEMNNDSKAVLKDANKCNSCGTCADSCPSEAIKMEDQDVK